MEGTRRLNGTAIPSSDSCTVRYCGSFAASELGDSIKVAKTVAPTGITALPQRCVETYATKGLDYQIGKVYTAMKRVWFSSRKAAPVGKLLR